MRCSRTTRERLDGGQMAARQVVNTFYGLKSKQLLRLLAFLHLHYRHPQSRSSWLDVLYRKYQTRDKFGMRPCNDNNPMFTHSVVVEDNFLITHQASSSLVYVVFITRIIISRMLICVNHIRIPKDATE